MKQTHTTRETHSSTSSTQRDSILQPGIEAPQFTLDVTPSQTLSLDELRGRPVVLAFYPADWSPVCGDQLSFYNEILPLLEPYDAQLVGISVDSTWCHTAYGEERGLDFPLLADFEPKGAVAQAYGVYREADGTSERALFVVDDEGVIVWSHLSPVGINPGANGFLDALATMAGEMPTIEETV